MDPEQHLVEHARRFAESGAAAVAPRLAATVLLLRPPFEVYLIRRALTMAFAADMYAFPGGSVDPRDAVPSGDGAVEWVAPVHRLGLPDAAARAVACAAVREVFEETGVLLAGRTPDDLLPDVSGADWEEARRAVEAREVGFADLLRDRGLVLRADLLVPWARWITPEFEPRRYDTYFFLTRLPAGQRTRQVGSEAAHAVWQTPDQVADLRMLPPTRVTLAQVAACGSIEAALAADRDVATPVAPRVVDGRLVY
jgi:8-oxo-dGTP pyrophosphatase MutT (NUDIX family)